MTERRQQYFVIAFNLATILLWAMFVYGFFMRNAIEVPWSVVEIFLLVLTYYAGDKEIRRWHRDHRSRKYRGEFIVAGWIATLALTFLAEALGGGLYGYTVPTHLPLTVGGVVAVYLITQYLKAEYRKEFVAEPDVRELHHSRVSREQKAKQPRRGKA